MRVDIRKIVSLRKSGYTLPEIMKVTRLPKTTIYWHIRDLPLSQKKIQFVRRASGNRIRKYAIARKGRSERPFRAFDQWTSKTVLLTAHLIFDGEIYRGCIYNSRSAALIERVQDCMSAIYSFEPRFAKNSLTGVLRVSYHNVALGIYMADKARSLLIEVKNLPLNLKREFVRAFFDDEGCADFRPEENRRSVRGYQKNTNILHLIRDLLYEFKIQAKVKRPNEVQVVGKENLIRFEKEINFSPGVYINGNRSNSRWKRHLEKRVLLRMAIESYQH